MKKIAIFVEGLTELITVREYLLKKFDYNISLKCYSLYSKGNFKSCPYPNCGHDPEYHFTIYNVSGDGSVVNEIITAELELWNAGYVKIIGLKDMFSPHYRKQSSTISLELNEKYIKGHVSQILSSAKKADQIVFCFAIMEVEAWYLGCNEIFQNIHESITPQAIHKTIGSMLDGLDPETTFMHPSKTLGEILAIANIPYDKHSGEIEKICTKLTIDNYIKLYESNICSSFNKFIDALEVA